MYDENSGIYKPHTFLAGEALYLYESDMKEYVYFHTKDGQKGEIHVENESYLYGDFDVDGQDLIDFFQKEGRSWAG